MTLKKLSPSCELTALHNVSKINTCAKFPRSNVNYSKQSQLKVFKPRRILIWNFVKVKIKVSFETKWRATIFSAKALEESSPQYPEVSRFNVMRGSKGLVVRILFIKGTTRLRYARVLVTSSLHIQILNGFKMYLLLKL